jgi:carbamoyltransferase
MGLAAYGNKNSDQTAYFVEQITQQLVDIREDGSMLLAMDFFRFTTHLTMTNDAKWEQLFQVERREPEDPLEQVHANLAFAVQSVLEKSIKKLAKTTLDLADSSTLVMAGGVALNSVNNGKLLDLPELHDLWIQPAAGDAGGALGAALAAWHIGDDKERQPCTPDAMQGAYLGPSYTNTHISALSKKYQDFSFQYVEKEEDLLHQTATFLASGKVVGWFQGRMEFGPRALGNRSILGDARNPDMQKKINQKIKFRESFRPFAPSVLVEDAHIYFDLETTSPYMLLVRPLQEDLKKSIPDAFEIPIMERLYQNRSDIPSVTHVDYSARIQTVNKATNPRYWELLNHFKKITGYGLLINTSLNVKDEPIVCTPSEALQCFKKTDMDVLVLNDFIVQKK